MLELCNMQCARMVDYVLEKEGDVAAVIAEPARAAPYVAPPGFWKIVRDACDRHGALLIFDEIPTGLGKTGKRSSPATMTMSARTGRSAITRIRKIR